MVRAFLHIRKGETLENFKEPADLRGAAIPAYCCAGCATVYEDAEATAVIHDDARDWLAECPCKAVELVDIRSVKFDFEIAQCTTCGALFEDEGGKVLKEGISLTPACAHQVKKNANARENNLAYWEEDGALKKEQPPVPIHIVRAVRLGKGA